jgi:hypothetical protein
MRALGQLHIVPERREHLATLQRGDEQSTMLDPRLGGLYGELLGMAILCH